MTEANKGSVWTIDHCFFLSKTNLCNETDMNIPSDWVNLGTMFL